MNIIQNNITLSSSDDDDDSEDDMMKEMFGVSKITNMTINDDEEESEEEEEDNNKNNYYSSLPENKIVNNNTTEKKKPVINTSTPISLKTIDPIYPSNNVEVVEKIKVHLWDTIPSLGAGFMSGLGLKVVSEGGLPFRSIFGASALSK